MTSIASVKAPTTTAVAARAVDAVKVYGAGDAEVRALDGLTVTIPSQRFTAVMGPSGSGKSTLLHCLAGLDDLTSGHVFLGDVELGSLSDRELTLLRRRRVGFVFQSFNLLPTLDAAENIALPATLAGSRPDRDWLAPVVGTLGLEDRLGQRPAELSGGQQQRVAMAPALATQPDIIFADQPTGNLDSRSGSELLAFMPRSVDEMAQTIVMVTHDPGAAGYADAVLFLVDGRVVDAMEKPTAERVLDRIKALEAR